MATTCKPYGRERPVLFSSPDCMLDGLDSEKREVVVRLILALSRLHGSDVCCKLVYLCIGSIRGEGVGGARLDRNAWPHPSLRS